MGYNLTIGEAYLDEFDKDDTWRQPVSPSVEELDLDEAPHFPNDMNPGCNYRWPSYSQWDLFCTDAGIHSLFYDKSDGLIRSHPVCTSGYNPSCVRVGGRGIGQCYKHSQTLGGRR